MTPGSLRTYVADGICEAQPRNDPPRHQCRKPKSCRSCALGALFCLHGFYACFPSVFGASCIFIQAATQTPQSAFSFVRSHLHHHESSPPTPALSKTIHSSPRQMTGAVSGRHAVERARLERDGAHTCSLNFHLPSNIRDRRESSPTARR